MLDFNPSIRYTGRIVVVAAILAGLCGAQLSQPVDLANVPQIQPQHKYFVQAANALNARPKKKADINITIEKSIRGDKDVPFPPSALKAIQLNGPWQYRDADPVASSDGRVIYTYGKGMPNIPCAVLHVTRIEFQPGEMLDGKLPWTMGDSAAWQIDTHTTVVNDQAQAYVTIKPTVKGSDTNLVVYTNRHAYDLRLISGPDNGGYVARVAFRDPEWEDQQKLIAIEAQKRQMAEDQQAERVKAQMSEEQKKKLESTDTFGPIRNTRYECKPGKHAKFMVPIVVEDDGRHVRIRLPESVRYRDIPELTLSGPTGVDAPQVHFNHEEITYTVDGIFTKAGLSSGVGKHQLKVEIINLGLPQ